MLKIYQSLIWVWKKNNNFDITPASAREQCVETRNIVSMDILFSKCFVFAYKTANSLLMFQWPKDLLCVKLHTSNGKYERHTRHHIIWGLKAFHFIRNSTACPKLIRNFTTNKETIKAPHHLPFVESTANRWIPNTYEGANHKIMEAFATWKHFSVIGPLWGKSTSSHKEPVTRSFGVFFAVRTNNWTESGIAGDTTHHGAHVTSL